VVCAALCTAYSNGGLVKDSRLLVRHLVRAVGGAAFTEAARRAAEADDAAHDDVMFGPAPTPAAADAGGGDDKDGDQNDDEPWSAPTGLVPRSKVHVDQGVDGNGCVLGGSRLMAADSGFVRSVFQQPEADFFSAASAKVQRCCCCPVWLVLSRAPRPCIRVTVGRARAGHHRCAVKCRHSA
jgi:hypothetical protein